MKAIYEFDAKDLPVIEALSADGTSAHNTGPREWQAKIGKIPAAVASRQQWQN
jgi:fumarate hydratase, class I